MNQLAVLLPVYKDDSEELLKAAVDSLQAQSFKEFDLYILVDGPVNKLLWKIIESFFGKFVFITAFKENRGLPSVLNDGINICEKKKYDFVARMDADDIAHPDRFRKQINYLNNHLEVDLVGTQAFLINNESKIIGEKYVALRTNFNQLLRRIDVIHPSTMFRIAFFKKFGYYNPYYKNSQDMDLWLRATSKGAIIHNINEKLYYLRFDAEVIKRRKRGQFYRIKIKKQYFSDWRYLIAILPNLLVIACPAFILKIILKLKTNKPGLG